MTDTPSYHDLHVTTPQIPRTKLFNLPYGLEVICNRVTGWQLISTNGRPPGGGELLAGEYAGPEAWIILDVAGQVIVNSRDRDNT